MTESANMQTQESLEREAEMLDAIAYELQCEADDARGRAEEAWEAYYEFDPGDEAEDTND